MKISDKLESVNDTVNITRYDNGFMVEVSGRSTDDSWKTTRILVSTIEEVNALVTDFASMKLND